MAGHKVYSYILRTVKSGRLREPFTKDDSGNACPGFGKGTYNAFLYKHRVRKPGGNSELFKKVCTGKFKLVRPFKYGFDC
jgi:hypothetical protein